MHRCEEFSPEQAKQASSVITEVPDETLTEWAIDGDVDALAELHRRYARIAARFAAVVSGRPLEAPDMVVDAFIDDVVRAGC